MSYVAWSACLCVGLLGQVGWGHKLRKNAWTDRDAIWRSDSCGSNEPRIRRGQDRTHPFAAARGDKTAMRPFARLLSALVIIMKECY